MYSYPHVLLRLISDKDHLTGDKNQAIFSLLNKIICSHRDERDKGRL